MFREMFQVTVPLGKVLSSTGRKGLALSIRPVWLAVFRSKKFARLSRSFKWSWCRIRCLLLLYICIG